MQALARRYADAGPTMSSPFLRMHDLATAGTPYAVATVVRTLGSTPQVVGAKLVLAGNGTDRPFGAPVTVPV